MARTRTRAPEQGLTLNAEWKPLSWVKFNPRNTKEHSSEQIKIIAAAIEADGFLDPIDVLPDGTLLAGEGRTRAMQLLGRKKILAIVHTLDEAAAMGYLVGHNYLTEMTGFDVNKLATEISLLPDADMLAMGFSAQEVELFADLSTADSRPAGTSTRTVYKGATNPIVKSVIRFDTDEDAETWRLFLAALEVAYPGYETVGDRLFAFVTDPERGGKVWEWT